MEPKPGSHQLREARQAAVRGDEDIATVHASTSYRLRAEFAVEAAKLKEEPVLDTEAERVAAIKEGLAKSVRHMHEAEERRVKPVVGMKAYSLAIMTEGFGLTAEQIVDDQGALSDLTEYLTDMLRVTKGIDLRSDRLGPQELEDEDAVLVNRIRGTWDLPDREFQFEGPYMYQRVDWVRVDPAAGN